MSIRRTLAVPSAVLAAASLTVPAAATAASSHWTKARCRSYVSSFHKAHGHATSKQKAAADRTLKAKGCSQKV